MKIHEKAKLYDELLKDFELLMNDIRSFKKDLADVTNREDLVIEKEKNLSTYYALLSGTFQAMPMALEFKLWKHDANLKFYKSLK